MVFSLVGASGPQLHPSFIEFRVELPSVEARGRWRERGGWAGGDRIAYEVGDHKLTRRGRGLDKVQALSRLSRRTLV